MPAFAYLRKSSVHDPTRELSYDVQESAVRDLAKRHNDNGSTLTILSDWDKSGRLGRAKRPGYHSLLEAIESGRCTAVYSYSLSRLARSVKELSSLMAECAQRDIPVRLYADSIDTSTASGRLLFNVLSSVAEFEADVASERVRAANSAKLARGETLGTTPAYGDGPGEDAGAVLEAFREAGSFSGAARLLNQRGVAPRNSKRGWWPSAVSVIVRRLDASIGGHRASGSAAGGSAFTLARLLRCPTCGTRLSGNRDRLDGPNHGRVRYACRLGSVMPHARVSISEHLILDAVRAEAEHLRTPEQVAMASDDSGRRVELEQRRARILDMYESGLIDRPERERRMSTVQASLEQLDDRRLVAAVPSIDWTWPTRELNGVLRALFDHIELDRATFQPISFRWTVPEWRTDG